MKRAPLFVVAPVALGMLTGCGSGMTQYTPKLRAQGELTLHYDDGFYMTAEGRQVSSGVTWGGLAEYVKCVPKAKEHAEAAQANGRAAVGLSWVGAGIGLASLGSLGGLAVYDEKNPDLTIGILGVGVAAAITGVVLAAVGRNRKNDANGNAVDAMNYYNDAVGSYGGTCRKPVAPPPEVEPVKPVKPEKDREVPDTPPNTVPLPADDKDTPAEPPPPPPVRPPDTI